MSSDPSVRRDIGPGCLLGFTVEARDRASLALNGEGGDPTVDLVARSHLLPGVLRATSRIADLCGSTDPCLTRTRFRPKGREWVMTIEPPRATAGLPEETVRRASYTLRVGIISWWSLGYWAFLFAFGLVAILVRRDQERSRPSA